MIGLAVLLHIIITGAAELVAVRVVFRQGSSYPENNTFGNFSSSQFGRLTHVGMRQQYLLGRRLYNEYWREMGMSNTYQQHSYQFNSSGENRTIDSLYSHLVGLLERIGPATVNNSSLAQPQWNDVLTAEPGNSFQEAAYHTAPVHSPRRLWNVYDQPKARKSSSGLVTMCPAVVDWHAKNLESSFYLKKVKPILDRNIEPLSRNIGGDFSLQLISELMKTFHFNQSMGYPTHPFLENATIRKDLDYLYFVMVFTEGLLNDNQINSTVTAAFMSLREQMRQVINGNALKMTLYSGSESELISQLAGLRLMDAQCLHSYFVGGQARCILEYPKFSSNLIYELHKMNGTYYVKIRYNGSYKRLLFCSYPCPYEQFERFLNSTITQDYKSVCGFMLEEKPPFKLVITHSQVIIMVCIGVVTFVIVVYFTCKLIKQVIDRNGQMLTIMTDRKRPQEMPAPSAGHLANVGPQAKGEPNQ